MNELSEYIHLLSTGFFAVVFFVVALYYFRISKKENFVFFILLSLIFALSMFMVIILPVMATFLFFLFFIGVIEQFFRKRKIHQLLWAFSLLLFSITSGIQLLARLTSWEPNLYRIYYVLASYQVFLIGLGVIFLLNSRDMINKKNVYILVVISGLIWTFFGMIYSKNNLIFSLIMLPALILFVYGIILGIINLRKTDKEIRFAITPNSYSVIMLIFSLFIFLAFVYYAFTSFLNLEYLNSVKGEVAGFAWQRNPSDLAEQRSVVRLFSPFFTVPGAIFLIGGTIISYLVWQRQIKLQDGKYRPKTGIFNIYIAFGALIITIGGSLTNFGLSTLSLSEMISALFMYFGFIESDKISLEKLLDLLKFKFFRKENMENISS